MTDLQNKNQPPTLEEIAEVIQKPSLFRTEIVDNSGPTHNTYKNMFCLIPYAHSQILRHTAKIAILQYKRFFKGAKSAHL